jgi:NTE family protein
MTEIGLVLQGGGALGAYEYGAITRLVEADFKPVAVTGVSIGAINAAAVAGARHGDIIGSLKNLWEAITLRTVPFLLANHQEMLSMFGNPHFYTLRRDWFNTLNWTSLCDVSPMYRTLTEMVDFDRLNDPAQVKFAVTATDVASGESVRFCNLETRITPDHILASGSLPPGFPMTQIGERYYWDGGVFDNTPLRPLIEILSSEQAETLPIIIIDLFPTMDAVPSNLIEVKNRLLELSYENRFWDDFGGPEGLKAYAEMLSELDNELPAGSSLRTHTQYQRMMKYRCLKNLKVITSPHVPMTGGMDFSEYGVRNRHDAGYAAADKFISEWRAGLEPTVTTGKPAEPEAAAAMPTGISAQQ